MYVAAVVAAEGCVDVEPLAYGAEQTADNLALTGGVARPHGVEFPQGLTCDGQPTQELGMHGIVYLACQHLGPFFFELVHMSGGVSC